jgi:DNA-binding beta-propeller fold protein YncE
MTARKAAALVLLALAGIAGAAQATAQAKATPQAQAATAPWVDPGRIAVSPDGRDLYATGWTTQSFHRDLASGELTHIDSFGPPGSSIAITPDGRWVYIGIRAPGGGPSPGGIHVLSRDPATGLLTHEFTFLEDAASHVAPGSIRDLAVSPDGRFLYVAQQAENALVVLQIDPATGALTPVQSLYGGPDGEPGLDHPLFELAVSPDGANLYLAADNLLVFGRDEGTGRLTRLPSASSPYQPQAWHVAVAPDGRRVYAGVYQFAAYDRDPATGLLTMRGRTQIDGTGCGFCEAHGPIAIAPDSKSMLEVDAQENWLLQVTATEDGAELQHTYHDFPGASDGDGVAWSPDGRFAYVAGGERFSNELISSSSPAGWIATFRREADGSLASVSGGEVTRPATDPSPIEGVTVNDGAIYTNDPHVQLRVTLPFWLPASLRISNSPDLAGVRATRVTGTAATYDWLLDTSGPVRAVKHVWLRFTGNGVWPAGGLLTDDIILDQTPPQVVSAALKRVGKRTRVTVRARDNRSGVKRLQVTRDRSKPGPARAFATSVFVKGAPRVLFLRVRDGAGNFSSWRRARR